MEEHTTGQIQSAAYLTGKINNIVFYQRSDTSIARTVPIIVHQSPATKIRSANFGIAASAGRVLRSNMQQVSPFTKNKTMQSRFSGAIARWLALNNAGSLTPQKGLPFISSFNFNEATSISER